MACGNKKHYLHVCGICNHWTIDVYLNPEKMTERCKLCQSGDCQFEE